MFQPTVRSSAVGRGSSRHSAGMAPSSDVASSGVASSRRSRSAANRAVATSSLGPGAYGFPAETVALLYFAGSLRLLPASGANPPKPEKFRSLSEL